MSKGAKTLIPASICLSIIAFILMIIPTFNGADIFNQSFNNLMRFQSLGLGGLFTLLSLVLGVAFTVIYSIVALAKKKYVFLTYNIAWLIIVFTVFFTFGGTTIYHQMYAGTFLDLNNIQKISGIVNIVVLAFVFVCMCVSLKEIFKKPAVSTQKVEKTDEEPVKEQAKPEVEESAKEEEKAEEPKEVVEEVKPVEEVKEEPVKEEEKVEVVEKVEVKETPTETKVEEVKEESEEVVDEVKPQDAEEIKVEEKPIEEVKEPEETKVEEKPIEEVKEVEETKVEEKLIEQVKEVEETKVEEKEPEVKAEEPKQEEKPKEAVKEEKPVSEKPKAVRKPRSKTGTTNKKSATGGKKSMATKEKEKKVVLDEVDDDDSASTEEVSKKYEGRKVYHVNKRAKDKKWTIKFANGERVIKLLDTKKEAIAYAEALARNQDGVVLVHASKGKQKGKIQKK